MSINELAILFYTLYDLEVKLECKIFGITHGFVEVDWKYFLEFIEKLSDEKLKRNEKKYYLDLYEQLIALLEDLGIISQNKGSCYDIVFKTSEGEMVMGIHDPSHYRDIKSSDYPTWGLVREKDAKRLMRLWKLKCVGMPIMDGEWILRPPLDGCLIQEERAIQDLKKEAQIKKDIESILEEAVEKIIAIEGRASIKGMKAFYELCQKNDKLSPEIKTRVFETMENAGLINMCEGFVVFDQEGQIHNPAHVFGETIFFTTAEDAIRWKAIVKGENNIQLHVKKDKAETNIVYFPMSG